LRSFHGPVPDKTHEFFNERIPYNLRALAVGDPDLEQRIVTAALKNSSHDLTQVLHEILPRDERGDGCMKKKDRPLKEDVRHDAGTSRSHKHDQSLIESNKDGTVKKDFYLDMVKTLFEKYRDRVSTYYCSNLTCKKTFWHAEHGYVCPECGSFGIISEFNADTTEQNSHTRHIIGYLDTIGRLICQECKQKHNYDDVGFIVYNNTQPYSLESCDICKQVLRRDDKPAS
jgi:hypothetical protein